MYNIHRYMVTYAMYDLSYCSGQQPSKAVHLILVPLLVYSDIREHRPPSMRHPSVPSQ